MKQIPSDVLDRIMREAWHSENNRVRRKAAQIALNMMAPISTQRMHVVDTDIKRGVIIMEFDLNG